MQDEMLDDDLPSPPGEATDTAEFDSDLLSDVPKMGEAIPVGTYAFRLDRFTLQTTKGDEKAKDEWDRVDQPYYNLVWICQQEPYTGKSVFENVPWVREEDVKDAKDPESPRRSMAQSIIKRRMPRAKDVMEGAEFASTGKINFRTFLGTHPELKLQLKLKERKGKDPTTGKYTISTGQWDNEVVRHLSLRRPT